MSNYQKVSCDAMKRDANDLSEALKGIPEEIERLKVSMHKLAGCWDGPAWGAYQLQVNKDLQKLNEVYRILLDMQKALGSGRDQYIKTEYEAYKEFSKLWI